MEQRISLLSPEVSTRLRSSFCIRSLAHAVSELIQNSVDADATAISIACDYQRLECVVSDNGIGISRHDLVHLGTRYATSKCSSYDTMLSASTYGFRGEAISSLCAVSNVQVISRSGRALKSFSRTWKEGIASDIQEAEARAPGTTVTVKSLFHNVPIRRKQRNPSRERTAVKTAINRVALVQPCISFTLKEIESTKANAIDYPKAASFATRLSQVYPAMSETSEVNWCFRLPSEIDCNVVALLPRTGLYHRTKDLQFLYVNGRYAENTPLHDTINQKWQQMHSELLTAWEARRYPMFLLNVSAGASVFDVSHRPDKSHVEFEHWGPLCDEVSKQLELFYHPFAGKNCGLKELSKTLVLSATKDSPDSMEDTDCGERTSTASLEQKITPFTATERPSGLTSGTNVREISRPSDDEVTALRQGRLKRRRSSRPDVSPISVAAPAQLSVAELFQRWRNPAFRVSPCSAVLSVASLSCDTGEYLSLDRSMIGDFEVLGQLARKFILCKWETHLFALDQHAVDERVRMNALSQLPPSIEFLSGLMLQLTKIEAAWVEQYQRALEDWGFQTSSPVLGSDGVISVELLAVPLLFGQYKLGPDDFKEFLAQLHESRGSSSTVPRAVHRIRCNRACKGAIRFGDPLTLEECKRLVDQLSTCALPFQCAHGRPSVAPLLNVRSLAHAQQEPKYSIAEALQRTWGAGKAQARLSERF